MTSCKQLEIQFEDPNPHKWCHPMKEDGFATFMSKENSTTQKTIFGPGSFFSPLLFGKFFDPSDAFPLWEFDSDELLPNLHSSSQRNVDWFQTDSDYVLKAEIPGTSSNSIQVCIENGKIIEINGQWRQERENRTKEWKSNHWWEHGFVRRLELPEQTEWRKSEAHLKNDHLLEIRIPKTTPPDSDTTS
ncbi:hypothetical protein BUALT_Bualt03G0124100 [Buddleja alternifolia]|uniref:SHSP domain-containing protein n=1 Tax=Buddleja alternifolia TaxID=168488 RepID=A0AAV6Y3Z3_9LAMI|nr:hypothetical protein BUALT_Bualt03G0124100 [Buddleja alternifolia]